MRCESQQSTHRMLPEDDDRRTAWLCVGIAVAPMVCAAAQVAASTLVERFVFVPAVAASMRPLAIANGCLAGVLAAWAAVMLPGGRLGLTVTAAFAAFVVGVATYVIALGVFSIIAALCFLNRAFRGAFFEPRRHGGAGERQRQDETTLKRAAETKTVAALDAPARFFRT